MNCFRFEEIALSKKFILCAVIFASLFNLGCRAFIPPFQFSEIIKIELLKVSHPLLGEAIQRKELDAQHYAAFYQALATPKDKGLVKMYTCYAFKVHTRDGKTFNFRTNGQSFFAPQEDQLYDVSSGENLIEKYWAEKSDCSAVAAQ